MDHSTMNHGAKGAPSMVKPGMDMGGNSTHHMMMMYFHTMLSDYYLFQPLYITTVGGMIGACIVTFILAALYEGLKVGREALLTSAKLNAKRLHRQRHQDAGESFVPDGAHAQTYIAGESSGDLSMLSAGHLVQTLLHAVQITLSYILMLLFMTYSVWLCLALVLGSAVGYFLFGWMRKSGVDITEHCH